MQSKEELLYVFSTGVEPVGLYECLDGFFILMLYAIFFQLYGYILIFYDFFPYIPDEIQFYKDNIHIPCIFYAYK